MAKLLARANLSDDAPAGYVRQKVTKRTKSRGSSDDRRDDAGNSRSTLLNGAEKRPEHAVVARDTQIELK